MTDVRKDGTPDAAEFGKLRAHLALMGCTQAWINSTVGASPSGKTRAQITADLVSAMRVLPKAKR